MDQILRTRERLLLAVQYLVLLANPMNGRGEESTPEESDNFPINSSADGSLNDSRDNSLNSDAADKCAITGLNNYAEDDITDMNPQSRMVYIRQEISANTPGPPSLDIAKNFDELILDDVQMCENESFARTPHRLNPRPPQSLSTLSQDDMTMDAEMGRPPRITNAGAILRLQQEDEREKTREKNILASADATPFTELPVDGKASGESKHVNPDGGQTVEKDEILSFIKNLAKSLNQPQPTLKMFDAAVVYDKADYGEVKHFVDELQRIAFHEFSEELRIELFDSEEFVQSMVMVVADVVDRCSVIFVYLTSNSTSEQFRLFCDEAIGLSRLGLNSPAINSGMAANNRKWILKPVHTQPLNRRIYKTPVGLLTLNGLDWYDRSSPFFTDKAVAVLKAATVQRKSREVERNTSLGYENTFGNGFEKHNKSSFKQHLTKSGPAHGPKHSMDSVDAMSLPTQTARPMTQAHVQVPSQQSIPQMYPEYQRQHQQTYFMPQQLPIKHDLPYPERNPYPSQFPGAQHQQQPAFDMNRQSQYAVQHAHPYLQGQHNINGFFTVPQRNQMYGNPPVQPPPFIQHGQAPPLYPSVPMQDNLSYLPPHSIPYPPHSRSIHIDDVTSRQYAPQRYSSPVPHGYAHPVPGSYMHSEHNGYRGQEYHQFQTRQMNPYQTTHASRQQSGAALGSLMVDQTNDTPASNDLKVVSRVTGKLITNPDLSNTDLEIDTHETPGVTPSYNHSKGKLETEYTDESSDDSESDGDEFDSGIKDMFPKKGKVINIFGTSVVQIGKHNNTIEKNRTKRVLGGVRKVEKRKEENNDKVSVFDGNISRITERRKSTFVNDNVANTLNHTDQNTDNSNGHSMDMRPSLMDEKQDTCRHEVILPVPETLTLSKSVATAKKPEVANAEENMLSQTEDKLKRIADEIAVKINDVDRCHSIEDNASHTPRAYTAVTEEVVDEDEMFGTGRRTQTQPYTARFAFSSYRTHSPLGFTKQGGNHTRSRIIVNTLDTSAEIYSDID